MRERLKRLRTANPKKSVEVWAQDEARLGLKPITRRVWSLKGRRPRSCGRTRYQWLYLYGFVRPETGWRWLRKLGFTLQMPRPRHPRSADPPTQKRWKKTYADG